MSVESDPLSRNALVVTILGPFEMVTGIIFKKVRDLTECEFIVACSIELWGFGNVSRRNPWCSYPQLSTLKRKCELQFWIKWLLDKQFQHDLFWTMKLFFSPKLLLINFWQFINQCFCLQSQQHGLLSSFAAGKYVLWTVDLIVFSHFLNSLSAITFAIELKYYFTQFSN